MSTDPNLQTVALDSGYTAGDGHMHLTAGHGARLPAQGVFWMRLPASGTLQNIYKVTARSTDQIDVTCVTGYGADQNHDAAEELAWDLCGEALDQLRADMNREMTVAAFDALASYDYKDGDRIVLSDGIYDVSRISGAWSYLYRGMRVTRPPSADWSWDNQASSTISSSSGYEYLTTPKLGAINCSVRYRTAPATPYSVKALLLYDAAGAPPGASGTKDNAGVGLVFRDSSGKLVDFRFWGDSGGIGLTCCKWTTTTSVSTAYVAYQSGSLRAITSIYRNPLWLGMRDNGTDLLYYWSLDGLGTPGVSGNWNLFDSRGRTDWFASGPTQIGFQAYANGDAVHLGIVSWEVIT